MRLHSILFIFVLSSFLHQGIRGITYPLTKFLIFLGYEIIEVSKNDICFAYDSAQWTSSDLAGSLDYTVCGSTYLMGGYNIYSGLNQQSKSLTRSYTDLPSHAMIYYTITIWAIDSWNANIDYFKVQFDSTTFTGWSTWNSTSFSASSICGDSSYGELANGRIYGRVLHSLTTLTMKMTSNFDQESTNESLGFRDINLLFATSPVSSTESFCGKASIAIGGSLECSCVEGQYSNLGTCTNCHISCGSCFGYGSNYCFQCASGYGFDGTICVPCDSSCSRCYGTSNTQCNECKSGYVLASNSTCVPQANCNSPLNITGCGRYCDAPCKNNYYSYWDGSCSSTCSSPLKTSVISTGSSVISTANFCLYPCTTSQYLYWDGTCQATCNSPFVQRVDRNRNFCDFPCASTEFAYWNGSCSSSCVLPLKQSPVNSRTLCSYPCASTEYLYSNGTCATYCDSFFVPVQEGGKSFCRSPCASSSIVYWNGSCIATCASPLVADTISGANVCRYPCGSSQYLYSNGSCSSSCSSNFVVAQEGGKNFCRSPCASSDFLYWNGSCISSCASPLVQGTISNAKVCKYPCASYEFLYPDGTCSGTCDSYFLSVQEGGKLFCRSPCASTSIVYWDQSCLSTCQSPLVKDTIGGTNICRYSCASSEYLYGNGICSSSCDSYFLTVQIQGRNLCKSPCATTDVLYWNKSCVANCAYPLVKDTTFQTNVCRYPCASNQYLYPSGSCSSYCDPYFTASQEGGKNFCRSPCASTGIIYWDGSCGTTCDSPLILDTIDNIKVCRYPCAKSEYLNPNGVCAGSCDPLVQTVTERSRNFCRTPCQANQYFAWDRSCANACDFPLVSALINSIAICKYPCPSSNYLYSNGSCFDRCTSPSTPRVERSRNFCGFWCPPSQWIAYDDSCVDSCEFPMRDATNYFGKYCMLPCDDNSNYYYPSTNTCKIYCSQEPKTINGTYKTCVSATRVAVSKLLHSIKYLEVRESPALREMEIIRGNNVLTVRMIPEMLYKLFRTFQSAPVDPVFIKRDLHSNFIVNFSSDLFLLAIFLCLEIFLSLIGSVAKKYNFSSATFIESIQILTRFNLPLMLIATNIGDILFFAIIQLKSYDKGTSGAEVSLFISLFMLAIVMSFLSFTSYLVYKATKAKKEKLKDGSSPSFTAFAGRWKSFQVLFGGCDPYSGLATSFFLVYTVRSALPMLFAALLEFFPFSQATMYLTVNLAIIGYILILNPIQSKVNRVNILLIEIVMLMINMCATMLATFDTSKGLREGYVKSITTLSNAIIAGGLIIEYIAILFLIVKFIILISKASDSSKITGKVDRALLYQFIFIPFQQGFMGFEEVQLCPSTIIRENISKKAIYPFSYSQSPTMNKLMDRDAHQRLGSPISSHSISPDYDNRPMLGVAPNLDASPPLFKKLDPSIFKKNRLTNMSTKLYAAGETSTLIFADEDKNKYPAESPEQEASTSVVNLVEESPNKNNQSSIYKSRILADRVTTRKDLIKRLRTGPVTTTDLSPSPTKSPDLDLNPSPLASSPTNDRGKLLRMNTLKALNKKN